MVRLDDPRLVRFAAGGERGPDQKTMVARTTWLDSTTPDTLTPAPVGLAIIETTITSARRADRLSSLPFGATRKAHLTHTLVRHSGRLPLPEAISNYGTRPGLTTRRMNRF